MASTTNREASVVRVQQSSLHPRNPERSGRLRAAIFLVALYLAIDQATAQGATSEKEWIAPASEAAKKNPVAASQDSISAGQKIYLKRCAACHGKTGNGDGPDAADLGIHPAKHSDPRLREESDGALFWKITTGKKPMPNYGRRLSETDRWNLVNYIRTLAK